MTRLLPLSRLLVAFAVCAVAAVACEESALGPELDRPAFSAAATCVGDVVLTTQAQVDAFSCSDVTGSLLIGPSTDIADLGALSVLTSVGAFLIIEENDVLTNVDGLSALTLVDDGLFIASNPSMTNLDGLSALTSVGGGGGGGLSIFANAALTDIDGLSALTSVLLLFIISNPSLTNLDGLSALTTVSAVVSITNNAALANVDGLSALTSVGDGIGISQNAALTDVDGLSALTSVGENLTIQFNPALTNVDGLSALTSVGLNLQINVNGALANLDGLSALTLVGRDVQVFDNDALTNVDGLSALTSVGDDLAVLSNDVLSMCACGLYGLLASGGVSGTVTIENNAPGCNSPAEITAEACAGCAATTLAADLDALQASGGIGSGHANALGNKLASAQAQADKGHYAVAVSKIEEFIAQVIQLEAAGHISSGDAAALIEVAETLRDAWGALAV